MGQNEMFSIRQMIELTGLSEFTIRGWENRYSAFVPHRSETGRREYSKRDVERALLLRELLKRGHKISKVAQLSNSKLLSLFEHAELSRDFETTARKSQTVTKAMELMALQKWSDLSALFQKVHHKDKALLIHDFFLPLLIELSQQIKNGVVSIAQEHVFSSFLKEKIYSVLSGLEAQEKTKVSDSKIRFVLAAPEGDFHEIGLLLAHLLLRSYGFTSLFLGPNTPAQDLAETALRFEASHLLVVSTISKKQGARQDILNFVSDVQKKIGSQLQILLAGHQAPLCPFEKTTSLVRVSSFHDLENYLRTIKSKKSG